MEIVSDFACDSAVGAQDAAAGVPGTPSDQLLVAGDDPGIAQITPDEYLHGPPPAIPPPRVGSILCAPEGRSAARG
jgi:hypothetical protein